MSDETTDKTEDSNLLYIRQGDKNDGYAEVSISSDKNSAIASFYPPIPGGSFLTFPAFTARLEDFGITTGILQEAIQNSILQANTTHLPVINVLVAQGTRPITQIPEHFVIRKDLVERKPEIDPDATRIDWHSISAFSIVAVKDPIARRIDTVDGITGIDIFGTEVPYPVQKITPFSAGSNVIEHPTGLFAGKNGRLSINSQGVITIEEVLVLKNGVDFNTGNIAFPGNVILSGKIADGFKIYTGGSLLAKDVVDVTEIVCKKDLIVQAGIEGRATGAIRVGGKLTAKYIQNCRVAVRGDILVSGSIIQSTVYSMGTIHMGDTGRLVGCECIVIGGVQALDIGSQRGSKTYIRCGTDFTVQQELDIANEQLKALAVKMQKAEDMYAEEPLPDIGKYLVEAKKWKAELANKITSYLHKIDINDAAYVEVRGSIFPGTEIEICHVPYTVKKIEKQVVFRLDKDHGMIVASPYKKS